MAKSQPLQRILDVVTALIERCQKLERQFERQLDDILPEQQASARNLIHYLALRQTDLRSLQLILSSYGVSSLGRTEAHVMASLLAVERVLLRLSESTGKPSGASPAVDFSTGPALLQRNTQRLLGSSHASHPVRVMVTMPSEAATNPKLVRDLVEAGMDIMRVNCAHDSPAEWSAMIRNLQEVDRQLTRRCRVLMDLGGPKLRTGLIAARARVVRWRPRRDLRDQMTAPARIWIGPSDATPPAGAVRLPLDLGNPPLRLKDQLTLTDTRGRERMLTLEEKAGEGWWTSVAYSATVEAGVPVEVKRRGRVVAKGSVGDLPWTEEPILLKRGDLLDVTGPSHPGRPATRGPRAKPASIPCTLPEVFAFIKEGERIFFDDGKIGGIVRRVSKSGLQVEITATAASGAKLRSDKGINLPDTDLKLPALNEKDRADLAFAARHADMIGMSFVRKPSDVEEVQRALDQAGATDVGIVLKIETVAAFENLPKLLLQGLQTMPLGVMVARGDLAVEAGFERLAEVQEEILWLCEAAHVPVIWATQVLETMAKKGMPSRAEVTDAAMSGRAECVMLNKGPYIVEAVRFLEGVLERMKRHQRKKASMLRRLKISELDTDA